MHRLLPLTLTSFVKVVFSCHFSPGIARLPYPLGGILTTHSRGRPVASSSKVVTVTTASSSKRPRETTSKSSFYRDPQI
ncbi:hypothetical protein BDR03DRAFT_976322 [Suillus americanus]|nr:hypothetical protein BDR03DRAFT_976322 [Suillus americanus]